MTIVIFSHAKWPHTVVSTLHAIIQQTLQCMHPSLHSNIWISLCIYPEWARAALREHTIPLFPPFYLVL